MTLTAVTPFEVVVATDVVSREALEAAAADLKRLAESAFLARALQAGRIVLDRLYDGDPANMSARDPRSEGLRALAAHPWVKESRATLQGYVSVYVMVERLQLEVAKTEALSYSHYKAVLGVPEGEQEKLLQRAAEEDWSVRELDERAAELKPQRRQRAGAGTKKVKPPAERVVADFAKTHRRQSAVMEAHTEVLLEGVTAAKAKKLAGKVRRVIEALEALEEQLRAHEDVEEPPEADPEPEVPREPEPVVVAPEPRPSPKPKRKPRPKPSSGRAPTVRPTPTVPAQRLSEVEQRFESDVGACWNVVMKAREAAGSRERLPRAIVRGTGVGLAFAERMALLADLPPPWQRRLESMAGGRGRPMTLTSILAGADLE